MDDLLSSLSSLSCESDPDALACQISEALDEVEDDPLMAERLTSSIVDICSRSSQARVRSYQYLDKEGG